MTMGEVPRHSILIADDHPIYRDGLRASLARETDFEVIGESGDGIRTLEVAREASPDVLLLDCHMPGLTTLDLLDQLQQLVRPPLTILISDGMQQSEILEALQLGARGVIPKDCDRSLLIQS